MKTCPKCYKKHEGTVLACDCGYDLSQVESQWSKKQIAAPASVTVVQPEAESSILQKNSHF